MKKVLLVEDDHDIRQTLEHFLGILGVDYLSCGNGKEAVSFLESNTIDVLITDFNMPEMDGVELLNWCRTQGRHFPVIFISANSYLVPKEKIALEDCCASLLSKPLDLHTFETALRASLERIHHEHCVHWANSLG